MKVLGSHLLTAGLYSTGLRYFIQNNSCSTVNTRGPGFESSHVETLIKHSFIVTYHEKEAMNDSFKRFIILKENLLTDTPF